jgi:hypothetical protein
LFSCRPDEFRSAINAVKDLVLELHRVAPSLASDYSASRRIFLRLRLRASACLARRLSPGFR